MLPGARELLRVPLGAAQRRSPALTPETALEKVMPRIDFLGPPGAAALYAPDSLSWQVYKNPVSMFIGGIAAVLLELAEPRVRSGIWIHSSFATNAITRIQRTGLAALVTIYAPADTAARLIATIVKMHERVEGVTPAGVAYRANDRALLDWVQATVSFGFLEAYACFVRPFCDAERDRFYAESQASAWLFGAFGAPLSLATQRAQFEAMRAGLEPHPIVHEFLAIMQRTHVLPRPLRALQEMALRAAVSILPGWVADRLELGAVWRLKSWERTLLKRLGAVADRVPLIGAPPAQACRRLGLPADYLYRQRTASFRTGT
jgi:uncharacterized protein (DUF2236 family)